MNRSQCYKKQVVNKLLSSKLLYPKTPNLQLVNKLITKGTIKIKNPEVGSATLHTILGRKPSFSRTWVPNENEYRLVHLHLTSNRTGINNDLDLLANSLLPFQLEKRVFPLTIQKEGESGWTIEGCTPPTPLNPLLFPYPINDERFNLTILLSHKNISLPSINFYLNLFQLPVAP